MRHSGIHHTIFSYLHAGPIALALVFVMFSFFIPSSDTSANFNPLLPGGVGGVFAPGAFPPLGDGNIITYTPCGPMVTIIGQQGGQFIWTMPIIQNRITPDEGVKDAWDEAIAFNGGSYFYAHVGHNMIGYAFPNPSLICSAYPLLKLVGVSSGKAL